MSLELTHCKKSKQTHNKKKPIKRQRLSREEDYRMKFLKGWGWGKRRQEGSELQEKVQASGAGTEILKFDVFVFMKPLKCNIIDCR